MGEVHKWRKLPKWSAGVGYCDEKLVKVGVSLKYLPYHTVVLCEPPRFSPFNSSSNWCLIEHYKHIMVLILYRIVNWDLFLTQNCLSPIHSSYSFWITKTCFFFFWGVIGGHITQSSSSSIVCSGVCFEKGNACSGGHSVFQNGPLPYPALSTFSPPPPDAGYHEGKQKRERISSLESILLILSQS